MIGLVTEGEEEGEEGKSNCKVGTRWVRQTDEMVVGVFPYGNVRILGTFDSPFHPLESCQKTLVYY